MFIWDRFSADFLGQRLYLKAFSEPFLVNSPLVQKVGLRSVKFCLMSKAVHRRGGGVIFCFFKRQQFCDRKGVIVARFPRSKVSQPETCSLRASAERSEEDERTVIEVVPTDPREASALTKCGT